MIDAKKKKEKKMQDFIMLNDTVFKAETLEKPSFGLSFPIWKTITNTKCKKKKIK